VREFDAPSPVERARTRFFRRTPGRRSGTPQGARVGLLLAPALAVVGVFFVGGVAQAVAQSLGYQPYLPSSRISPDAYVELWNDPAIRASLLLTARVAAVSTTSAAVLGVTAALLIRSLRRSRSLVHPVLDGHRNDACC